MPSRLTLECGYRDDHSAFYSCLSHCFDRLSIISLTIRISMVDEHFFLFCLNWCCVYNVSQKFVHKILPLHLFFLGL